MNAELMARLAAVTEEEKRLLHGSEVEISEYAAAGNMPVVDSAKMMERGKLIAIRPHTRFAAFPRHQHNYVEIMYMCSGSTTHIVNDKTKITLRAGELLFLNQHATHAIRRAGEHDIAVNFMVLSAFFDDALALIGRDNLLSNFLIGSLRQNGSDISYLHFQVADVLPVQNLVENLVWSLVNRQANTRRIHQATMGLLLLHLLNHTDRLSVAGAEHKGNTMVLDALRAVQEEYKSASLSDVAARYRVSVAYLSRLVREATGSTYKELLQTKRLTKAAQLLRETNLSVQDTMAAVGYDNSSYFYRLFHQKYGLSPRAYREASLSGQ